VSRILHQLHHHCYCHYCHSYPSYLDWRPHRRLHSGDSLIIAICLIYFGRSVRGFDRFMGQNFYYGYNLPHYPQPYQFDIDMGMGIASLLQLRYCHQSKNPGSGVLLPSGSVLLEAGAIPSSLLCSVVASGTKFLVRVL
jgi:hypothetical protein